MIAARYLDQSRQLEFPKGREPAGLLALGLAYYRAGRYPQAVTALSAALPKNPDAAVEIERALTDCLLQSEPPQFAEALRHLRLGLSLPALAPLIGTSGAHGRAAPVLELRDRVQAIYDAMRAALRRGDLSAFGAAFDSLGRAVGRAAP